MSGGFDDDPAFRGLGDDLRSRVGPEIRAEAEEGERLAALAALRRRSLTDVVADLRNRGDTIAVRAGGASLVGVVVYAGHDFFTLRMPTGRAEVHLAHPLEVEVVDRARVGGVGLRPGPSSFRGRLLELEGQEVSLSAPQCGGGRAGRLRAVGRDHVVVTAGAAECFVPLLALAYVAWSGPGRV